MFRRKEGRRKDKADLRAWKRRKEGGGERVKEEGVLGR